MNGQALGYRDCMTTSTASFKLISFVVALLSVSIIHFSNAQAELYLGGQVGATLPFEFDRVKGISSASTSDAIELSNSLLYGGKVGYFLPSYLNWLGVEADVYHGTPNFKQHSYSLTGAGGTSTTVVEGIHLGMTTLAMRVVIRNPGRIPGEQDTRFEPGAGLWQRFEPYGALGPAFFFTHTSTNGSTSDDTGLGFSFALGSRFFLSPQVALFAEYKLDAAKLSFMNALAPGAGLQGDYTAHNLVVGMSYHFQGL